MDVKLQIANLPVIEGRVRERELDLGIVGGHALRPGQECLAAGMLDELVLIVSPAHAWARRRDVIPESLPPSRCRAGGGVCDRSVTERALQRVKFRVAMELDHTEAIKQGVMAGLGVAFVTLRGAGRNSRRAASRPSGCEGFAFSDISTSFTTRPGESRRAHAPSWSYSSRRHARGEGLEPSKREIIRSLQRHHLPISRHPDLSVTIFVLVWRST